jgi:nickel-dependent lactate racemase
MQISIPYGKKYLQCNVVSERLIRASGGTSPVAVPDLGQAVSNALAKPIGSAALHEICQPHSTVSIVVNDITRPFLTDQILPPIFQSLHMAGVNPNNITIVIATGIHRPTTPAEQKTLLGNLPTSINVINHVSKNQKSLAHLGYTSNGAPVTINKIVAESDVKILTGLISPHQQAGFTGGRKSILPGIASYESIKEFHSAPLNSRAVVIGKLEDNLTHQTALEAAKMTKIDFIVNVVHTSEKGVLKVVAGDLEQAWMEGVNLWRERMQISLPEFADISITSPGGYPRDINLWQSQKAIASAELVTKEKGIIILVAQCKEGLGEQQLIWEKLLVEAGSPLEAVEKFEQEGYLDGSGKAFTFARALLNFRIFVVSEYLSSETLNQMFMEKCFSLEEALEKATGEQGDLSKIAVLPDAVEYLPTICMKRNLA